GSWWKEVDPDIWWRWIVQSQWRVACVRIPRFPIGAVLRQDAEARAREAASQLALPLEVREAPAAHGAGEAHDTEITGTGARNAPRQAAPRTGDDALLPWAAARREAPRWPGTHWDELPVAIADASRLRAVSAAAGRRR